MGRSAGQRAGFRMAIRRLGAHLFRRSAWWGYALAGLCLAVYVLIRLWFPEGDA